jgi:hypothetical protein
MNTQPEPAKVVNGFAQHFVTLRNRYFVAIDLLIFCATPALAVWLRTEGIRFGKRLYQPRAEMSHSACARSTTGG